MGSEETAAEKIQYSASAVQDGCCVRNSNIRFILSVFRSVATERLAEVGIERRKRGPTPSQPREPQFDSRDTLGQHAQLVLHTFESTADFGVHKPSYESIPVSFRAISSRL